MLPGLIAGHYPREALEMDLVRAGPPRGCAADRWAAPRGSTRRRAGACPGGRRSHSTWPRSISASHPTCRTCRALPNMPCAAKPLGAYAGRWAGFVARCARGAARYGGDRRGCGRGGTGAGHGHRLRAGRGRASPDRAPRPRPAPYRRPPARLLANGWRGGHHADDRRRAGAVEAARCGRMADGRAFPSA
jgi:hypothetical protein